MSYCHQQTCPACGGWQDFAGQSGWICETPGCRFSWNPDKSHGNRIFTQEILDAFLEIKKEREEREAVSRARETKTPSSWLSGGPDALRHMLGGP